MFSSISRPTEKVKNKIFAYKDNSDREAKHVAVDPGNCEIVNFISIEEKAPESRFKSEPNPEHQKQHKLLVFDELSARIAKDPVLYYPILEWGTWPQTIYAECRRLGVDRVRAEIQRVRNTFGLDSRGRYLRASLRKMKENDAQIDPPEPIAEEAPRKTNLPSRLVRRLVSARRAGKCVPGNDAPDHSVPSNVAGIEVSASDLSEAIPRSDVPAIPPPADVAPPPRPGKPLHKPCGRFKFGVFCEGWLHANDFLPPWLPDVVPREVSFSTHKKGFMHLNGKSNTVQGHARNRSLDRNHRIQPLCSPKLPTIKSAHGNQHPSRAIEPIKNRHAIPPSLSHKLTERRMRDSVVQESGRSCQAACEYRVREYRVSLPGQVQVYNPGDRLRGSGVVGVRHAQGRVLPGD